MKNFNLFSILLLCLPLSVFASIADSLFDKTPFENPDYIGYRLAITDLSYQNEGGNKISISYRAINTGRKDLLFGKNISAPPYLVVNFDYTLAESGLYEYAEDIRDAIINGDFIIKAGDIAKSKRIKIRIDPSKQFIKPSEEIVELPDFMKQGGSANDKGLANKEDKLIDPSDSKPNQLTSKGFADIDENACSDLVIKSIRILKKNKKQVTLEYTIVNQGPGPAKIINSQKKEEQNMALRAHYSTRDKMTKGSLTFGGGFISEGLKKRNGKLYPGEKYSGKLTLNIQKMTDFTPYIILELDPYLTVSECDKTNNKGAIKVGEGRPGLD